MAPGACLTSAKSYCFIAFVVHGSLSRPSICPSAPPRSHRLLEAARWNRAALVGRMKGLRAAVLVGIGFSAAVGALALGGPAAWMGFDHLPVARHPNG